MDRKKNLVALASELRAYASALTGHAPEAEDLVQEAIARALSAPSVPRRRKDLRPWMFRVIRNLHIDTLRKSRVRMEYVAEQKRLYSDEGDDASDMVQDLMVRQAYESLGERSREILFLVDIMGLRYAEAADVLEVPQGTVMSRLARARQALIEKMETGTVKRLPVQKKKQQR